MIARIWSGKVARADRDAYADYVEASGITAYEEAPGNRGVWMLRRDVGETTEFVLLTFWDSIAAIEAFAGERPEVAVFYPEDERFLVEREVVASHYEVCTRRSDQTGPARSTHGSGKAAE